jgi:signal transduction histidine kinase
LIDNKIWIQQDETEDGIASDLLEAGVPKEDQPKVFTPFFPTKDVGAGTGLGLAICYGIVTDHGGEIRLESEPGRGAEFMISLPEADN